MAQLHIVNKSPFEHTALSSCLRLAKEGAGVLLIEDGIYAALQGSPCSDSLKNALGDVSVYALAPDMRARGIGEDRAIEGVTFVDYEGFVRLTTEYDKVNSWL